MDPLDVTVVVATYGDDEWAELAQERAVPSAEALGAYVVSVHGPSLHEARNAGLGLAHTEWVIHLDADDELEPGYLDEMATGTADLRAPAVRYIMGPGRKWGTRVPRVAGHNHHDCRAECLLDGNYLVVGTFARTELLRNAGGWRDWPLYEDWDLWLRCYLAGATVETIPRAVYRAHVRADSRNRAPSRELKDATHRAIVADVLGARA